MRKQNKDELKRGRLLEVRLIDSLGLGARWWGEGKLWLLWNYPHGGALHVAGAGAGAVYGSVGRAGVG